MITEKFQVTSRIHRGRQRTQSRRFVVITGSDLPKFADVLIAQAAQARTDGNERAAVRLERMAAEVRTSRKFKVELPLDAKIT